MNNYNPGLHMLSTFRAGNGPLTDAGQCRLFFDAEIERQGLHKVGEVYHSFENGGFTAVVCLTESHVSIHTWPEFGTATFDVFLSNFMQDNSEKVRQFYAATLHYFGGEELNKHTLTR